MPLAARPNSTALSTSVWGAWSVTTASAVPSSSASRQAAASSARAQRRIDPERRGVRRADERPVRPRVVARLPRPAAGAGEPFVGEREVVRRDVAGDRESARPSPAGRARALPRSTGGSGGAARPARPGRRRPAPPGRGRRRPPRRRRPAAQPEHGRHVALVRLGAGGQRQVLGMIDDRQAQRTRIGERRSEDRARSEPARRRRRSRPHRRRPARRSPTAAPLPDRPSRPRGQAARPASPRPRLQRGSGRAPPARRAPASCSASRRPS